MVTAPGVKQIVGPIACTCTKLRPSHLGTHYCGRRLDAILFSPAVWDIHPLRLSRYHDLPPRRRPQRGNGDGDEPNGASATTAAGHGQRVPLAILTLRFKFTLHITQWSKEHSAEDDHRTHLLDRADAIIAVVASFIQAHPRPERAAVDWSFGRE